MRVLVHGTNAKIITCEECSCQFLYDPDDIKTGIETSTKEEIQYVRCPECGKAYKITPADD